MKGKMKNHQSKRYNNKYDNGSTKYTCFGCGKQGHMKVDCPSLVNKEKADETHQIWEEQKSIYSLGINDTSSSTSSHEDVEENLCLMAGQNFEVSSMNSSTSFNSENSSSLLSGFLRNP